MKKLVFASLALLCSSYTHAADLSSFGLESLTPISNEAAETVRGQGGSTLVRSVGTSSMAFSIVDPETGSIFNMNSTSQQSGYDGIEFVSADSTFC